MTQNDRRLDDWLAEVAEADRTIAPPLSLEAHVMARVHLTGASGQSTARSGRSALWIGALTTLTAAVVFFLTVPWNRSHADPTVASAPVTTESAGSAIATPAVPTPILAPVAQIATPRATPREGARRAPASRTVRRPAEREVLDFVPLVPLSEEELHGAFQIVRVQWSRGLGGPVQADVLLGQDGLARAIRVSSPQ